MLTSIRSSLLVNTKHFRCFSSVNSKVVASAAEAVKDIKDGATL